MKLYFPVFLLLLITSGYLYAQNIIWANKNDELYRCAENKLLLDISRYPYNELTVKPDTGIIDGSDGQYAYSVDELVDKVTFTVFYKGNKIAQKSYDLYYYPYPVGYICNRCPYSWIYKSELTRCKEIKVLQGIGSSTVEYRIIRFEIEGVWKTFKKANQNTSGFFTEEMLAIFQNMNRNDKIYITNLEYVDNNGIVQRIPDFSYIVK